MVGTYQVYHMRSFEKNLLLVPNNIKSNSIICTKWNHVSNFIYIVTNHLKKSYYCWMFDSYTILWCIIMLLLERVSWDYFIYHNFGLTLMTENFIHCTALISVLEVILGRILVYGRFCNNIKTITATSSSILFHVWSEILILRWSN